MSRERIRVEIDAQLAGLIDGYLESCRPAARRSRGALAAGDFESVRAIGHDLKGTGSSFGFERISAIGVAVEAAGERRDAVGTWRAIEELAKFLDRVEWTTA